jgi:hypothetical protein
MNREPDGGAAGGGNRPEIVFIRENDPVSANVRILHESAFDGCEGRTCDKETDPEGNDGSFHGAFSLRQARVSRSSGLFE